MYRHFAIAVLLLLLPAAAPAQEASQSASSSSRGDPLMDRVMEATFLVQADITAVNDAEKANDNARACDNLHKASDDVMEAMSALFDYMEDIKTRDYPEAGKAQLMSKAQAAQEDLGRTSLLINTDLNDRCPAA